MGPLGSGLVLTWSGVESLDWCLGPGMLFGLKSGLGLGSRLTFQVSQLASQRKGLCVGCPKAILQRSFCPLPGSYSLKQLLQVGLQPDESLHQFSNLCLQSLCQPRLQNPALQLGFPGKGLSARGLGLLVNTDRRKSKPRFKFFWPQYPLLHPFYPRIQRVQKA